MNAIEPRVGDPESLRRDYEAVRAWLLDRSERRFQEIMGVDLGPPPRTPEFEALEEDIRQALLRVGAGMRVRLDDLVKDPRARPGCEVDQAYAAAARAYFDAVVAPRIAADAAVLPERRRPGREPTEGEAGGRRPLPYAVLAAGTTGELVERVLPHREIHSSWRWAEAQFDPTEWMRDLLLDVQGHGKGWVGAFLPDFNNGDAVEVTWLFYWEPTYLRGETPPGILAEKKTYTWSIEPTVDCLGSVHVHAWDEWTTSKQAGVTVDISVLLIPIPFVSLGPLGLPILGLISKATNVCFLDGQNILKFLHLDDAYHLGLVSPHPLFRFHPHWIAVQARAVGWTRGDGSRVVVDLTSGNNSVFLNFMRVWEEGI